MTNHFSLYGIPEKKNPTKWAFVSSEYKELCKSWNIEIQYCSPRMHTGNGTVEINQSEKEKIIKKLPELFENNRTIKVIEMNVQLKPGHHPVKQKARPIPLHLQKDVGRELEKLISRTP